MNNEALEKLYTEIDFVRDKLADVRVMVANEDNIDDELTEAVNATMRAGTLVIKLLGNQPIVVPPDAPLGFDAVVTRALYDAVDKAVKPVVAKLDTALATTIRLESKACELVERTDAAAGLPSLLNQVRGSLAPRPTQLSLQLGWTCWLAAALVGLACWILLGTKFPWT